MLLALFYVAALMKRRLNGRGNLLLVQSHFHEKSFSRNLYLFSVPLFV